MGGRGQGELLWCRSLPGPTSSHVQPMSTVEPAACKERLSAPKNQREGGKAGEVKWNHTGGFYLPSKSWRAKHFDNILFQISYVKNLQALRLDASGSTEEKRSHSETSQSRVIMN